MELTPGYRQTEVGVIPGEWGTVRLHSLVAKHNSGVYKKRELYGSGCNIVGVSDLYDIHSVDGQVFARVPMFEQERAKHTLAPDDLLYGESSLVREGIARTVYVTARGAGTAFAWHTRRYSVDQSRLLSAYLYYYLQAPVARKHMMDQCIQTAITGINTVAYFACPVPIPPLPEQRAIAAVLSDVDALLAKLDQLIAKKRDLKQVAMQQLLTGRQRLPGFSGEWEVKRFGDLFQFLNTANNPRADLSKFGDVGYIHYGDIHTSVAVFLDCVSEVLPLIAKTKVANIPLLQDGDSVMADASEDYEGIGKCVEIRNATGRRIVAGLHTFLLRGNRNFLADGFKGYLQFIPSVKAALVRFATGISVYGISKNNVRSIEVLLPSIEEQTAIAAVLSDMGAELAALEARLAKTRVLKRGMMQELLTGKTRLL